MQDFPENVPHGKPTALNFSLTRIRCIFPSSSHRLIRIIRSDCKLNLRQDKAGYGFTIEIPAEIGALLGFDVKIDDASGVSVTETVLGGGKKLHQNRCNFSIVKNGKEK